ncbi:MAG: HlyD family secretion protein, partial [Rudaea sp.]
GMPASVSFAAGRQAPQIPAVVEGGSPAQAPTFSGSVEERQTLLVSEIEAAVKTVTADKGDLVKAGDALVTLDEARWQDAEREANATVKTAQANLDAVQEPARPGALAMADATVGQARADADAARRALADADRVLANPQDLNAQVHAWEGRVQSAQAEVKRSEVTISDLQRQIDQASNDGSQAGKTRVAILQKQLEAAGAGRDSAQATADGSAKVLGQYRALARNPLDLIAARNAAAKQVAVAEAAQKVAEADSAIARRGPQAEALAAARARLQVAQASAELVSSQGRRYTIVSPVSGRIVAREAQPGETARPGVGLLTVADTASPEVTVYVPVADLGSVEPGHGATVRLPSLPGKLYAANVTYIAPEAEFKPANIYNSQDRSELVYAVRVAISNPDGDIKAGLPADVTFH